MAESVNVARGVIHSVREFCGLDEAAGHLRPRWVVLRGVGLVYVLIFAGIIPVSHGLIGHHGIYPVAEFFGRIRWAYPSGIRPLLLEPSLFWISSRDAAITLLQWIGLGAAGCVLANVWPRWALAVCWLIFLSFYSAFGVFAPAQLDILMLEVALLCIPYAPAGRRPGLGDASPPRPIAVFAMRWLLLRVMFESGVVKLFGGDPHWRNFTAMNVMYETAPFPTVLGYFDHQMPQAYHVFEIGFTFLAELAAPIVAVFGGRRGRWSAFVVWVIFQIGIELTCNFGWLNLASIVLGFALLDAFGIHFIVTLLCFALFLRTTRGLPAEEAPAWLTAPLDVVGNFHSANAYTLYARFHSIRDGVEFAGSNDAGKTWRTYEYRYLTQRVDRMCPFIAPWFPRFEATLEGTDLEAGKDPSRSKSSLYAQVARQLAAGNPEVIGLFPHNPFADRPATLIRMRYYQLSFTSFAGYRKTGHFWRRENKGEYLPMVYRDEQGRVVESNLAEGDEAARRGDYAAAARVYQQQYAIGYPFAGLRLANLLSTVRECRGIRIGRSPSTPNLPLGARPRPGTAWGWVMKTETGCRRILAQQRPPIARPLNRVR
jgi:hypothetical protein